MRRREFIALLGGAAAAWPPAVHAQQPSKLPLIGFAGSSTASTQGYVAAIFSKRLGELGWIEGRTVAIEYRWAEGRNERATEILAGFVRLKVDVIVTVGTPLTMAAKQATSLIPIVFAVVGDPVGSGMVTNLPRPGGNITGLSNQAPETATRRLGLLHDVVPNLRRLAIMANVGNPLVVVLELKEVQSAASTLGLTVETSEIRSAEDIAPAFEMLKDRTDAQLELPPRTFAALSAAARRRHVKPTNLAIALLDGVLRRGSIDRTIHSAEMESREAAHRAQV